jgi:hypothetical protein
VVAAFSKLLWAKVSSNSADWKIACALSTINSCDFCAKTLRIFASTNESVPLSRSPATPLYFVWKHSNRGFICIVYSLHFSSTFFRPQQCFSHIKEVFPEMESSKKGEERVLKQSKRRIMEKEKVQLLTAAFPSL